jgi:D-alanyl-D-alanine carboxypeptidase
MKLPLLGSLVGTLLLTTGLQSLALTIEPAVLIKQVGEAGKYYQFQTSTNLADTNAWVSVGFAILGRGEQLSLVVPTTTNSQQFYRVQESGEPALTPAKKDQINAHLDQAIQQYEIPGIIAGVKIGDQVWMTARGVANKETQEPLTPDHRVRIGSASKSFVGMAVMQLIAERRLNLDDTIKKFLNPDEIAALSNYYLDAITVRMLLNHTSGIQSYTDEIDDWFVPYIYDRKRVWTDLELLRIANGIPGPTQVLVWQTNVVNGSNVITCATKTVQGAPIDTPGRSWHYSNSNFILLGIIAERVTSREISEIIAHRFLIPLGLTNSFYPRPGSYTIPGTKVARGYMDWANFLGNPPGVPTGLQDVTEYDPSGVGAAGPMISTCGDLLKWIYSLGRHGETMIGQYARGHVDWKYFTSSGTYNGVASRLSYGMALAHEDDPTNQADYYIVGHRGQISGYDTAMQYLPELDTAIVVICNRSLKFAPGFPSNANLVALNFMVKTLYPGYVAVHRVRSTSPNVPAAVEIKSSESSVGKSNTSVPLGEWLQNRPGTFVPPLSEYGR